MPKQSNINVTSQRLLSLDVFRGITIAAMILVNTIVTTPFAILDHSKWHGCTLADLVFPFFLFAIGVSLSFTLSKQLTQGIPTPLLYGKILKRTLTLFALGLFLNAFPHHLDSQSILTLRVYGVLQRIALCYFFTSVAFITLNLRMQLVLTCIILLGYWYIMTYVPIAHYGAGNLSPEGNVAAYLDRLLFSSVHLYGKVFDPEGLFSTLPAITTTLLGSITGCWLRSNTKTAPQKLLGMIVFAAVLAILGWFWGQSFPINKALWTSSYVLWTAGLTLGCLATCYWLIEIQRLTIWAKPFELFGLNAIIIFIGHVLFFKLQLMISLPCSNGHFCNARNYILHHVLGWLSLPYASLAYAISSVLFWLLIATILYRKKIFIRI